MSSSDLGVGVWGLELRVQGFILGSRFGREGLDSDPCPPHQSFPHNRYRAKREQLERFQGHLPENQGQNLALTVLGVPGPIDSGRALHSAKSPTRKLSYLSTHTGNLTHGGQLWGFQHIWAASGVQPERTRSKTPADFLQTRHK